MLYVYYLKNYRFSASSLSKTFTNTYVQFTNLNTDIPTDFHKPSEKIQAGHRNE